MSRYQDTDFNPDAAAEQVKAEEEQELARKIRREVMRIHSGEADEDIRADREQEERKREEEERARRRLERRDNNILWQIFTGTILVRMGFKEYYRYLFLIALMFFFNIAAMFNTLRMDIRAARLQERVTLEREQSIRLHERVESRTSHSAIVELLRERKIELHDSQSPVEVIELEQDE